MIVALVVPAHEYNVMLSKVLPLFNTEEVLIF